MAAGLGKAFLTDEPIAGPWFASTRGIDNFASDAVAACACPGFARLGDPDALLHRGIGARR
jgi:hypothetical protein